jgi:hypothetical protein
MVFEGEGLRLIRFGVALSGKYFSANSIYPQPPVAYKFADVAVPVDIILDYPSKLERSRVIAPGVVAGAGF